MSHEVPEQAFFTQRAFGRRLDFVKTMLVFFDGIAVLVPSHRHRLPDKDVDDPYLAEALEERRLITYLTPEELITEDSVRAMLALVDALPRRAALVEGRSYEPHFGLYNEQTNTLVGGKFGYRGRYSHVGRAILAILQDKGWLTESVIEGVYKAGSDASERLLGLLAFLLSNDGGQLGLSLQPVVKDMHSLRTMLEDIRPSVPVLRDTMSEFVASDMAKVPIDTSRAPLDEVLAFKQAHGAAYRTYVRDLRAFIADLGSIAQADRPRFIRDRSEQLRDAKAELRRYSMRSWRRPLASLTFGIGGASVSLAHGNPEAAGFALASALAGFRRQKAPGSVYSYVFELGRSFPKYY